MRFVSVWSWAPTGDIAVTKLFSALCCNLFRWLLMLLSCLVSRSTCGLVAMTSAPHAEDRQLDPGQVHDFQQSMTCVLAKSHVFSVAQLSSLVILRARPGVFFDAYRWDALGLCWPKPQTLHPMAAAQSWPSGASSDHIIFVTCWPVWHYNVSGGVDCS